MQLTGNLYHPNSLPPHSSSHIYIHIPLRHLQQAVLPPFCLSSNSSMAPAAIARHTTKTVCVMDSSSRLGAALVDRLLHRGYAVHAAAFARGDATKAAWSENKRVRVFRADPLDYNSIAEAIRGCSGLFYTFDDESSYDLWHALAKTLSEKTAWALAMDRGVDMVAVNAGLILAGSELSPSNPYLKGAPEMYEDGVLVTVKLKFLVDAHICVFENPEAYGRYLCFNHTICHPKDAIKLAQMLSPGPSPPPSDGLGVIQERIHSKKLNKLLLEYRDGLQVAE